MKPGDIVDVYPRDKPKESRGWFMVLRVEGAIVFGLIPSGTQATDLLIVRNQ